VHIIENNFKETTKVEPKSTFRRVIVSFGTIINSIQHEFMKQACCKNLFTGLCFHQSFRITVTKTFSAHELNSMYHFYSNCSMAMFME
jgi:S-adenosylmethionine hydrolase